MNFPPPAHEAKIVAPGNLAARLSQLPRPLVFTNGCFDILHRGHVTLLSQARALGKSMLVAVNSDASVKRLGKGGDRPVNVLADRLAELYKRQVKGRASAAASETMPRIPHQLIMPNSRLRNAGSSSRKLPLSQRGK